MTLPEPNFFEGTEKKFELEVHAGVPSLRDLGERFWTAVTETAAARVLSRMRNSHCDAYLLSESSLFVYPHKAIMITCGRTNLGQAVLDLLRRIPPQQISFFIFERKNEVYPHAQPTSFFDDVRLLREALPGSAYRFGDEDGHHILLYQMDRSKAGDPGDATTEILMYGIEEEARRAFHSARDDGRSGLRERIDLTRILPGFEIDDYFFRPRGYSLNALRGEFYATLHVTPEEYGPYVSFETNLPHAKERAATVRRVLEAFRPRSFDLFLFDQAQPMRLSIGDYRSRAEVTERMPCGYDVRFFEFYRPSEGSRRPVRLPLF